jgi:hypothetical protein
VPIEKHKPEICQQSQKNFRANLVVVVGEQVFVQVILVKKTGFQYVVPPEKHPSTNSTHHC